MSVQQRYTPEFRSEAVKLVLEQKLSHLVASKRVGIPEGTLASWMAAARSSSKPSAHGSRSTSELLAENSQLCKELAENLLDQTFSPSAPNEVWVTDITYIPTGEGWLYLSGVNDVFTCEIVGYAMSKRMTQELTGKALFRAAQKKRPAAGLIHHSDRGSQYCAQDFRKPLKQFKMKASMSRKGNCYDNAPMESFWGSLKNELVHHCRYETRVEDKVSILEYIEIFYNRQRRHSRLGYIAPAIFSIKLQ